MIIRILYDYLDQNIMDSSKNNKINKKNIICYSHKSNNFINLIKDNLNFKFIKLHNFSQKQIINIFKKTKVYLDFGFHPGKDKMPREAALFDNCIITNKKGSAKNNIDIPIKKKFKIFEKHSNLVLLKKELNSIFNNYQREIKHFKSYKFKIINEKHNFKKNLNKIFIKK